MNDYTVRLGEKLKELRVTAGKSKADIAKLLQCSESKIGKIERGEVAVAPLELAALLDFLGVSGEDKADLQHLGEEARQRRPKTPWGSAIPDRIRRFFNTEETAMVVQAYRPELIHGLVQTESYARAVIRTNPSLSPRDVERLVQARMARQTRLESANPPRLHLIIAEGALRAEVGGPAVQKAQLKRLSALAERSNIEIQAIPFRVGAHAGFGFPFTILLSPGTKKSVYVETLTDGLFVDEDDRVAHYEKSFTELSHVALDQPDTLALIDTVIRQL